MADKPQLPKTCETTEYKAIRRALLLLPREDRETAFRAVTALNAIAEVADTAIQENIRKAKVLEVMADACNDIRLHVKYLAFDLDATRRERDNLQKMLEDLK